MQTPFFWGIYETIKFETATSSTLKHSNTSHLLKSIKSPEVYKTMDFNRGHRAKSWWSFQIIGMYWVHPRPVSATETPGVQLKTLTLILRKMSLGDSDAQAAPRKRWCYNPTLEASRYDIVKAQNIIDEVSILAKKCLIWIQLWENIPTQPVWGIPKYKWPGLIKKVDVIKKKKKTQGK
jgi:hypothetical protein